MQQPVQNTEQYREEQRQEVDVQKENFQNTRGIWPHFQIQKGGEKIFSFKNRKIKTTIQEITDKMRLNPSQLK